MRPGLLFAGQNGNDGEDGKDDEDSKDGGAGARPAHALAERVAEDLGLSAVIDAMAAGDPFLADTARAVLLSAPPGIEDVTHRQQVLADCLAEPGLGRELYELAGRAVRVRHDVARAVYVDTPETLLNQSIVTLTSFAQLLRELRTLAGRYRPRVSSAGFKRFFALAEDQFDDAYLDSVVSRIGQLSLDGNLLVSARLGTGNQSEDFTMRRPRAQARGLFRRDPTRRSTYRLPYGDEAAGRAVSALRDQALAGLAVSADRAARQVLAFFTALRTEAAFYLGSLHLREELTRRGAAVCRPDVLGPASPVLTARGLYDPGLQLRLDRPVAANDLTADGTALIMVTGANRGGKSTFLRGVGLAQLMAAAGTFVAATAFTTSARTGVFTHFTTDEDDSLTSGKLDDELRRMSRIADLIGPRGLLLCNESFQSTNEREGSGIARRVIDAMTAAGVTVVVVTHLHELAQGCYDRRDRFPALFLRADRDRSFHLHEAPPEATSYGTDLWNRTRAADR